MDPANIIPARHVAAGSPEGGFLFTRKNGRNPVDHGIHPLYRHLILALSLLILTVTLVTLPVPQAADIFKWTDEQGRVHYGDRPEGQQVVQIITTSGPAQDPTHGQRLQQQRQLLEMIEEDRQKFKQARTDEKAARAIRQANCDRTRTRLAEMQNARFIYVESKDPDNPHILSERDTAKALATANHDVELWCSYPPK